MENVIFYDRLYRLISSAGKSFNQVERELGYPRNALKNYSKGGMPSGVRLLELSNYFCVSPYYLLGINTWKNSPDIAGERTLSEEKYRWF